MPDDPDSLEPTLAAWSDVTDTSPTIKERRAALVSSPQLGAKFKVLGYIGRGGMGTVFKVRHRKLDHGRAVKVLPAAASPEMIERLRREAAIGTDLTHPNIVTVYDLEELEDGSLAIVMEFLRGDDLDAHIKRHGRMEVREVRELFAGVADAIDRMHAKGVVHRDLKPANLFLCEDGTLKVLDFGISRLVEGDSDLTRTGASIGTPSFMSPEQIEGEPASSLTDVYSLGAVLFYCLTGHKAFQARTQIELITKILSRGAPRADEVCADVPVHVANAVERALAIEPEKRWASATQLLDAMVSEETQALEVALAGKTDRRRWWLGGLAVAAAVAIAVVAGVVGSSLSPEPPGEAGTREGVASAEPVRGGTLRMGLVGSIPSLDPLIAKTDEFLGLEVLLYDGLLGVDWRGELTPALASSWERLDGGQRYVFYLRDDAVLHDDPCLPDGRGHPVDARDVQRSLERTFRSIYEDEDSTWKFLPLAEGFEEYMRGETEHPTGIRIIDDRTVEVEFTRPAPSFAHCLNRPEWFVVAAEAIDVYGSDEKGIGYRSVGTGPYRVETASDVHASLIAHEHAWQRDGRGERLPYLDRVEVSTYKGNVNARAALRDDKVDLLPRLPLDALEVAMSFDWSQGRAVPREGWEGYQTAGFLDEGRRILMLMLFDQTADLPYLHDERLRQAFSLSIDRHSISVDPIIPTMGPLVDGMLGYEPSLVARDLAAAKELLGEAGFPGGAGLPELPLCCLEGMREDADQIAANLAEIGVNIRVSPVQPPTWMEFLQNGGCTVLARFDEIVLDDDPTDMLSSLASRTMLTRRRPQMQETIDQLHAIENRADRAIQLQQINHALVDDAMVIYLNYRSPGQPVFSNLAAPCVQGLADPTTGLHNPRAQRMRELWKQPD